MARRFDADGWGPWSEKAGAIYAHAPAWALSRVIALRVHMEFVAATDPVECCAPQGGAIAMRPLIIHSSSKVRSLMKSRRVLHIEYADSLELADGIRLAVV